MSRDFPSVSGRGGNGGGRDMERLSGAHGVMFWGVDTHPVGNFYNQSLAGSRVLRIRDSRRVLRLNERPLRPSPLTSVRRRTCGRDRRGQLCWSSVKTPLLSSPRLNHPPVSRPGSPLVQVGYQLTLSGTEPKVLRTHPRDLTLGDDPELGPSSWVVSEGRRVDSLTPRKSGPSLVPHLLCVLSVGRDRVRWLIEVPDSVQCSGEPDKGGDMSLLL